MATQIRPGLAEADPKERCAGATKSLQPADRAALRRVIADLVNPEILRRCLVRWLQDQITAALPSTWERRAETFESVGTPSADEAALSCRKHAWFLRTYGPGNDVLAEVEETVDSLLGVTR